MTIEVDIIKEFPQWVNARGRQPFTGFDRSPTDITHIAIHGTGGPRGYSNRIREGRRKKWYPDLDVLTDTQYFLHDLTVIYKRKSKGSGAFNYFISEEGDIYQTLDPLQWGYVQNLPYSPRYSYADRPWEENTISIEHYNPRGNNQGNFTDSTTKSGFKLVLYLLQTFPTITSISGHGAGMASWLNSKMYKVCPGPNYDWDGLAQFLTERKYTFEVKPVPYRIVANGNSVASRVKRSGTASNEYLTNIVCTDPDAPVSESDSKTEEKVVETNTTNYDNVNDGNENVNADIFKDDPYSYVSATMKEVAVDGCILNHKTGSPITGGNFTITSTPSTKTKAESKGVFTTPLLYTFSGGNASGCDPNTVTTTAPQSITATTTKNKDSSKFIMRKEDFGTMTATGTLSGVPVIVTGIVEISDAGQTKVKSN